MVRDFEQSAGGKPARLCQRQVLRHALALGIAAENQFDLAEGNGGHEREVVLIGVLVVRIGTHNLARLVALHGCRVDPELAVPHIRLDIGRVQAAHNGPGGLCRLYRRHHASVELGIPHVVGHIHHSDGIPLQHRRGGADMVIIVMRQYQAVNTPDAVAVQRAPDKRGVRLLARVNQNDPVVHAQKDAICLANAEEIHVQPMRRAGIGIVGRIQDHATGCRRAGRRRQRHVTGSTAGAGRIRDTGTIVQRHGSGTADAAVRVQDHIRAGGQAQQGTQHQQCRGKQQMRPPPVPFSLFHMPTSRF